MALPLSEVNIAHSTLDFFLEGLTGGGGGGGGGNDNCGGTIEGAMN